MSYLFIHANSLYIYNIITRNPQTIMAFAPIDI